MRISHDCVDTISHIRQSHENIVTLENNEETRLILILNACEHAYVFLLQVLPIRNVFCDLLMRRLEWNGDPLELVIAVSACIYDRGHAVAKYVVYRMHSQ